jgi:glutaminase
MMHVGTIGSERGLLSNTGRGATPHASRTPARQLELSTPIALESPVLGLLREVHAKYLAAREGAVASYIPELERVAPDQFGIALATVDGHLYEVGDSGSPFTIQSISKPLVYGLALQDRGREAVLARIGVEPSGDAFNAILFDERTNRPFNSMVNTGAIAATSLVWGKNTEERLGASSISCVRSAVARSRSTRVSTTRNGRCGHRNRAIAYLELNNGMIKGDVDAHLDLYFRQCSVLTTAIDLAFIAATLAKGGVHPVSGERALATEQVRDVLSVMTTCGMYDYAGEWELRIGLPAKSGVGGGIMAVLPSQLGIGVFSPRLDEHGNSYRGIRVCEELCMRFPRRRRDRRAPGVGRRRKRRRRTGVAQQPPAYSRRDRRDTGERIGADGCRLRLDRAKSSNYPCQAYRRSRGKSESGCGGQMRSFFR